MTKRITTAVLAGLMVVSLMATPAAATPETVVERLAGDNRYGTAVAVAEAMAHRSSVVYVASAQAFPDAVAGAAAAGARRAPVLLVSRNGVPAETQAALRRLAPERVVVLGGPSAVDDAVVAELAGYATSGAARLSGTDRYSTSAVISRETFPLGAPVAYIASGRDYPDALAGAAAAGSTGGPVLLVPGTTVTAEVRAELQRLGVRRIVVLGGEAAVSDTVLTELRAYSSGPVRRIAGANRYATAAAVAEYAFADTDVAYLASGDDFPDALAGAAAAGTAGAPVLLSARHLLPAEAAAQLDRLSPRVVRVLGGAAAISETVVNTLRGAGADEGQPPAPPSGGTPDFELDQPYTAPPPNDAVGLRALEWARTQIGKPYRYGGAGPDAYDCSGLTLRAFEAAGAQLPRTTRDQWAKTRRVALDDLRPGDLVFWSSNGEPSGIHHVAIYAGENMRLHSPNADRNVELAPMYTTGLLPYGGRVF